MCELTGSMRASVDPPGYFFAKWRIVAAIQFSAARFAISAFCSVVNSVVKLSIRFPPRLLCRLLLALQNALHLCISGSEIADDRMSLASATWGLAVSQPRSLC